MGEVRSKYAGEEGSTQGNRVEFNSQNQNILKKIITLVRDTARLSTTLV